MKLKNSLYYYPETGMLDCNTYVVSGSPGLIIDPGSPDRIDMLLGDMRRDGINPEDIGTIVNTHLHLDHSWGDAAFKEASGARIILHPLQKEFYDISVVKTAQFFGFQAPQFTEDDLLEGDTLEAGGLEFKLIPAPGHSPDSICYYCPGEKVLVCGDVLFSHNTGRADLPGGNEEKLKQSIEDLSVLQVDILLPGHMAMVNGAAEVRANFDFIKERILPWL